MMERGGTQGIQFIVQIVLARLLTPNDFGVLSLIAIFITISNVFVQSGFNTSLIQKKNTDEVDFSSVFYISLFVTIILYIMLFLTAPLIADFYGIPEIIDIIRVLGITLFLGCFNSIQSAVISKKMQFKKLFFSSISAVSVSGIIGIILAYNGFGVWALVAQQLTSNFIMVLVLGYTVRWKPKLVFSLKRVRSLFAFGWKLLVAILIDTLYMNLRSLIIGKIFNPTILGFYNRGDQFPQIIVSNINGSIQSVMLPVLSEEQDDKQRVKNMVRRSIVTSSFIVFPLMVGLAVVAESLVKIVLTDKWLPCVPFLRIFCFSYALWPIHTANMQAINALGRSEIILKIELIKKTIGLAILVISLRYGVYAIAIGTLISGVISSFINSFPNKKLLNYSISEQCKDIIPLLILSLLMGSVIYSLNWLNMPVYLTLISQVFTGCIIYIYIAKIIKLECYTYLITAFTGMLSNKKR